jgi:TolB-like protein/Tfp pilus assembly protein PilF
MPPGLALYMSGAHGEAEAVLRHAIALGPALFEAHYFAGRNYQAQGRFEQAAACLERAAELQPDDFLALGISVATYRSLGRDAEMRAAGRRCLERIEAEIAVHPDNVGALSFGATVQADVGDPARAELWAARAASIDSTITVNNYNLACAYAAIGKTDFALRHLQRVFAAPTVGRRVHFEWLKHDSSLAPLHGHAEFEDLVQRLEAEAKAGTLDAKGGRAPRIAVLPFVNMSDDADQQYSADGLTEDIIADLSRIAALSVVPYSSVVAGKGKALTAAQAARELQADFVLEGSVRRDGNRVCVTGQLIDGKTGSQLWAGRHDRGWEDIFALQDDISRGIVEALKIRLLPQELASVTSRATSSPDAYQYYLRGRAFFMRSSWGTRALRVARQMYAKAIEIDPGYARAYAGIANCDSYLVCMGDPALSFQDILANSGRALSLDPQLAEAHAAKGLALYTAGRHGEADAALDLAVRLGPDLFEAHFFAARNCRAQGQHEKAAALFERAAELQPSDFRALGLAVNAYRSLGRIEEALSAARRCLERAEAVARMPAMSAPLPLERPCWRSRGQGAGRSLIARAGGIEAIDPSAPQPACACAALKLTRRWNVYAGVPRSPFNAALISRMSTIARWYASRSSGVPGDAAGATGAGRSRYPAPKRAPAIAVLPFEPGR